MRIYSYVKKQTSQSGELDLINLLPESSFSFPLLLSFSLPSLYLFFSLLSHLPCKIYDIQSTHKILTGQPSQRLLGICIIEVSAHSLCGPENLVLKLSDMRLAMSKSSYIYTHVPGNAKLDTDYTQYGTRILCLPNRK